MDIQFSNKNDYLWAVKGITYVCKSDFFRLP